MALLPGLPRAQRHHAAVGGAAPARGLARGRDAWCALLHLLDLAIAYMQFRIREEDQYKTSFRVPGGQYRDEFCVGAFDLHGMSSVLMRYMHHIFGRPSLVFDASCRVSAAGPPGSSPPMLGRFVQVYCDDILIFSKTGEEHLAHVLIVLETLRHHTHYAKASKCQFGSSSVSFLGHVISERGVAVDPGKVAAVAEWAPRRARTCAVLWASLITTVSSCCTSPPLPPL